MPHTSSPTPQPTQASQWMYAVHQESIESPSLARTTEQVPAPGLRGRVEPLGQANGNTERAEFTATTAQPPPQTPDLQPAEIDEEGRAVGTGQPVAPTLDRVEPTEAAQDQNLAPDEGWTTVVKKTKKPKTKVKKRTTQEAQQASLGVGLPSALPAYPSSLPTTHPASQMTLPPFPSEMSTYESEFPAFPLHSDPPTPVVNTRRASDIRKRRRTDSDIGGGGQHAVPAPHDLAHPTPAEPPALGGQASGHAPPGRYHVSEMYQGPATATPPAPDVCQPATEPRVANAPHRQATPGPSNLPSWAHPVPSHVNLDGNSFATSFMAAHDRLARNMGDYPRDIPPHLLWQTPMTSQHYGYGHQLAPPNASTTRTEPDVPPQWQSPTFRPARSREGSVELLYASRPGSPQTPRPLARPPLPTPSFTPSTPFAPPPAAETVCLHPGTTPTAGECAGRVATPTRPPTRLQAMEPQDVEMEEEEPLPWPPRARTHRPANAPAADNAPLAPTAIELPDDLASAPTFATAPPPAGWRRIEKKSFYARSENADVGQLNHLVRDERYCVGIQVAGSGVYDDDGWKRLCLIRKALAERLNIRTPTIHIPNPITTPGHNEAPYDYILSKLDKAMMLHLVGIGWLDMEYISIHFKDLTVSPPRYVAAWIFIERFPWPTEDGILAECLSALRSAFVQRQTRRFITNDIGRGGRWHTFTVDGAFNYICNSAEVRILHMHMENRVERPIAQFFCESPTSNENEWVEFCELFRSYSFRGPHSPQPVAYREPMLCKLCHSADHSIGLCDLLTLRGWKGPTAAAVATAEAHAALATANAAREAQAQAYAQAGPSHLGVGAPRGRGSGPGYGRGNGRGTGRGGYGGNGRGGYGGGAARGGRGQSSRWNGAQQAHQQSSTPYTTW
ncbi:uncharacterized protein B0H18DRAFT_953547 [Fomitopsis serialis]|uniref:uncharacterized protein n=1 Tax=Fomitopsis serialis TaxID=139415 RepID=UPI002007D666|nr:uncharacterized protein B0H18DRAFT_953547 [Neoantrodia serialis]KAH9929357.1 hypothetical protein B0H18DRAFT_953547 [Neoantrodia serialis]